MGFRNLAKLAFIHILEAADTHPFIRSVEAEMLFVIKNLTGRT